MISQLQEQLAEEKGRARETEAELKAEVDKLSKTCHSQQQVSRESISGPIQGDQAVLGPGLGWRVFVIFPLLSGQQVAERSGPPAKGTLKIESSQPRSETCMVTLYLLKRR